MPEHRPRFDRNDRSLPANTLAESGLEGDGEAFLRAARLAEKRVADVAAAIAAFGTGDEAVRARLENRRVQPYEQLRERLRVSSMEAQEALDRALQAARAVPESSHPTAELPRPAVAVSPRDTLGNEAPTMADFPAPSRDESDRVGIGATLVVADSESMFLRPSRVPPVPPAAMRRPPAVRQATAAPLTRRVLAETGPHSPRRVSPRRLQIELAALGVTAILAGAFALRPGALPDPLLARVAPVRLRPRPVAPVPTPTPPEDIIVVPGGPTTKPPVPAPVGTTGPSVTGSAPEASKGATGLAPAPADPSGPRPIAPAPVVPSVTDLMAQGTQALKARDYDAALARYAEVLAVDPGNEEAATASLRAKGGRAARGRFFQTQATVRDIPKADEKQCEWGPCAKARVLDCKLEYAITPPVPVQGEPYRIDVTAVNTGEKTLKIQSQAALLFRNGAQAPHPLTRLEDSIARGERKRIAAVDDVWTLGTTSWWLEVTVKDQKGDSYRAQVTWELPRATSR